MRYAPLLARSLLVLFEMISVKFAKSYLMLGNLTFVAECRRLQVLKLHSIFQKTKITRKHRRGNVLNFRGRCNYSKKLQCYKLLFVVLRLACLFFVFSSCFAPKLASNCAQSEQLRSIQMLTVRLSNYVSVFTAFRNSFIIETSSSSFFWRFSRLR